MHKPHRCKRCQLRNPYSRWMLRIVLPSIAAAITVTVLAGNAFLGLLAYLPYLFVAALTMRWERIHSVARLGYTWAPPGSASERVMTERQESS